jgi:hypothetical protein
MDKEKGESERAYCATCRLWELCVFVSVMLMHGMLFLWWWLLPLYSLLSFSAYGETDGFLDS